MVKSVVLDCEACGRRFLSTGETKCIMCELAKGLDTTPKELTDFAVDQVVGKKESKKLEPSD